MEPLILFPNIIKKSWGREEILINDEKYCAKILVYDKAHNFSSFHLHLKKTETFYLKSGSFNLRYKAKDGKTVTALLKENDVVHLPAGTPHQLTALEDNSQIFEISTTDDPNDVVRIEPTMN